jgi:hypothetical protein
VLLFTALDDALNPKARNEACDKTNNHSKHNIIKELGKSEFWEHDNVPR